MNERAGLVTMDNRVLTLQGDVVRIGNKAPDFEVIANDLSTVKFSSFRDKVCIILSLPSLDTPVCDKMARQFNLQAADLEDVVVLAISMDLPFAQKRWCAAEGIDAVQTLSDHRDASFGENYGVLIKELRLLARFGFIIDREGIVRYKQIVTETSSEPDYEAVLSAVKEIA